jgi:predicted lipoprotein with Yx(FWY)xxD motif
VRTTPVDQHLELRRVTGLGRVLTDGDGRALYVFPPDARDAVRCTGPCAGTWPTFAVRRPDGVVAAAGVRSRLVGTMPDPTTGDLVVTYDGQPLYHYAGDVRPGQLNGQGLFVDGGPWYLVDRAGRPVTAQAPSPVGRRA